MTTETSYRLEAGHTITVSVVGASGHLRCRDDAMIGSPVVAGTPVAFGPYAITKVFLVQDEGRNATVTIAEAGSLVTAAEKTNLDYIPIVQPNAFARIVATLQDGVLSTSIAVLSDSTAVGSTRWVNQLGLWLASKFPNYNVALRSFIDGSPGDYGSTQFLQGIVERSIRFPGGGLSRGQAVADVGDWTSDLDVSAKVSLDNWTPAATNAIVARYGGGGSSFILFVTSDGKLHFNVYAGSGSSATSTNPLGFTNGTTNWVRGTYVQSTGVITVYTSSNGVTWSSVGTTTSALTSGLNKSATQYYEIGAYNCTASTLGGGTQSPLTGNIFEIQIRNGILGPIMNIQPIEAWQKYVSDLTSLAGNPTIYIDNGGISGATIGHLSDSTRLPMLLRNTQPSLVILGTSINDGYVVGVSQITSLWDSWLAAIKSRAPLAEICIMTESPILLANSEAHNNRLRLLMAWAARNGIYCVDTYRAFVNTGSPNSYIAGDNTHPTAAGSLLQASAFEAQFSVHM